MTSASARLVLSIVAAAVYRCFVLYLKFFFYFSFSRFDFFGFHSTTPPVF
jgi:hypothetical protein